MDRDMIASVVAIVATAIAGSVLLLRCITRFCILRKAWVDDFFAILAFLCSVGVTYIIYTQEHGHARADKPLSPEEILLEMNFAWANVFVFTLAMLFVKLSALTQYLRFIQHPILRTICFVMLAVCTAFTIAAIFVNAFGHRSLAFAEITDDKCIDGAVFWYFSGSMSMVTDVVIVVIPIAAVKSLTMPPAQKKALIMVFALGGCGCITVALRLYSVHGAIKAMNATKMSEICLWMTLETNIGITCISIPPLKALIVAIWPDSLRSRDERGPDSMSLSVPDIVQTPSSSGSQYEATMNKQDLDP